MKDLKLAIFCKPVHMQKIVNFLNEHSNINIKYVIFDSTVKSNQHEAYYRDFDVGISYCAGFIIDLKKEKKIKGYNAKWFNYHPHPLPEYKGYSAYAKAIKNKVTYYGVTLHRLVQKVDSGEIIQVRSFNLDSPPVDVSELGNICHYHLFQLFKETIEHIGKINVGGSLY